MLEDKIENRKFKLVILLELALVALICVKIVPASEALMSMVYIAALYIAGNVTEKIGFNISNILMKK